MDAFSNELEQARTIAIDAGKIILEHHGKELQIIEKDDGELATHVDKLADEFIVNKLAELFPDDAILSEERLDDGTRLERKRVWIVDPIDGTFAFFKKGNEFAVHIALVEEGQPVVGVVHIPAEQKTYYASKDNGAFMLSEQGTQRLSVSNRTQLHEAKLVTGYFRKDSFSHKIRERVAAADKTYMSSMGVKMGVIAEGKFDFYFLLSSNSKEWDLCAPHIILAEAGGHVTHIDGRTISYNKSDVRNSGGIMASNKRVHDVALQELQQHTNVYKT